MHFYSSRERWLWIGATAYTLCIYSTLALARQATTFLREKNLLRVSIATLALLVVAAAVSFLLRRKTSRRQWGALGLVALGYAAVLPFTEAPEEAIHLVEYGVLALLIHAALSERGQNSPLPQGWMVRHKEWAAFGVTTLAGLGDEILQGILPSRYYDTRDVVLNAIAAALAMGALAVVQRAGGARAN